MRIPVQNLPEDWIRYCREKRPDLVPAEVWENFRDHWRAAAGAKGLKADWDATWRTWVRKEGPRKGVAGNPVTASSMPPPTRAPTPGPILPPPPTRAQLEAGNRIAEATLARIKGYAGGDSWARRILDRHAAGERLLPQQLQAARMALREHGEAAIEPASSGMRPDASLPDDESAREAALETLAMQMQEDPV